MIISGFGGKGGSLSSRSSGVATEEDRSGGFLNLVRSIAGDDLLFCLDPNSITAGIGETVNEWFDSLGAFDTHFTAQDVAEYKPSFSLYNNKPVLNFNGANNAFRSAQNASQLNNKKALSLIYFAKANGGSGFESIFELHALWYIVNGFAVGIQRDSSDYAVYYAQDQDPDGVSRGGVAGSNGTNVDVDLPIVHGVVFNRNGAGGSAGTTTRPFVNGVAMTAAQTYTGDGTYNIDSAWVSNKLLYMGARGLTVLNFNGSIGTFIAVTRVLTDDEMGRLSRAVLRKHNLGTDAPAIPAPSGGGGDSGVTYNIDEVAGQNITDTAGTLYDDGGPTGTYSQTDYTTYIVPGAGKKVVITMREFEMGPGDGNFNEKLRFFNTTSGILNFYGSMTDGGSNAPTQDQVINGVDGGTVTIIFDQSGYYGAGGFFSQDAEGFKLTWEIVDV